MATTPHRRGRIAVAAMIVALVGGFVAVTAAPVSADNFDVTNSNDDGPGSLRQAIADAAANPGPDTITVQIGLDPIELDSELEWNGDGALTIEGNDVIVDFRGAPRGFVDDGGDGLEISSMTIVGVGGSGSLDNAPVVSEGGGLTLSKCTITGNSVRTDDGDAAGGVLSEGGPISISSCTITGNSAEAAGDAGGGVLSEGGNIQILDSVISGNLAEADGDAAGGVLSEGGDVAIGTSEIDCNQAAANFGDAAGGVLVEGGESFVIRDSEIVGNTSASADGDAENSILSFGPDPQISGSTIDDDTSSCTAPPPTSPTTSTSTSTSTAAPSSATATPRFTG